MTLKSEDWGRNMNIRFSKMEDLERIVEIYNDAIDTKRATADLERITTEDRRQWMIDHTEERYPVYIAEEDGKVVGWCSISPYRKGRRALDRTAEISYYIDFDYHGKGICSRLVEHALKDCKRLGVRNLFAFILGVNERSISLLKKFGFEQWGLIPEAADLDGLICDHCLMGKQI